jgi:Co/Zn/Cd efflux system component
VAFRAAADRAIQLPHWAARRRPAPGSQVLQADALDFLSDTLTYGMSLAVIGLSLRVRATAALIKAATLALTGLWVFGTTIWRTFVIGTPRAEVWG